MLSGAATVGMKLLQKTDMTGNPLLLLSVGAVMLGGQFIVLGMLGELCARIYFRVKQTEVYGVRRSLNFTEPLPTFSAPQAKENSEPQHQKAA